MAVLASAPAWSRDSPATSAGAVWAAATARPVPEGSGKWNPSSRDSAITTAAMPNRDHQGAHAGLGACRLIGLSGG